MKIVIIDIPIQSIKSFDNGAPTIITFKMNFKLLSLRGTKILR